MDETAAAGFGGFTRTNKKGGAAIAVLIKKGLEGLAVNPEAAPSGSLGAR